MADEPMEQPGQSDPIQEVKSPRARKFLRLFLMAAGGLAAPCLALAAFFLSNSGASDTPTAKKAGVVQNGRVTTTTRARPKLAAPVTTTTTTAPASPVGPPPRDPFQPLVVQAPKDGSPAR